MDRIDIADKFALMWQKSRSDAGKSQDYVAKAMGVSKKTVQNWEQGLSCPSQRQGFEWFKALGLQPLPYYLELLYPDFDMNMENMGSSDVNSVLCSFICDMPLEQKQKLLYILSGEHGSSPIGILEMVVAHLQLPLSARITTAQSIKTHYEIAQNSGVLCNDVVKPNTELLTNAYTAAMKSVMAGQSSYTLE